MRTFLVLLMVLIASGDDKVINGVLEGDVLLPCDCPDRILDEDVKWQMDMKLVIKYNGSHPISRDRYKGRVQMFVPEDSNNCSIVLTNITKADQGKYLCIFTAQTYRSIPVYLNISENVLQALTGGSPHNTGSVSSMRHSKTIPVVVTLGFSLISEIFI